MLKRAIGAVLALQATALHAADFLPAAHTFNCSSQVESSGSTFLKLTRYLQGCEYGAGKVRSAETIRDVCYQIEIDSRDGSDRTKMTLGARCAETADKEGNALACSGDMFGTSIFSLLIGTNGKYQSMMMFSGTADRPNGSNHTDRGVCQL